MSSFRIKQVSQLITEEMARIFLRECDFPIGCLVTVLGVETSRDLLYSRIVISVFPVNSEKEVLTYLGKNIYHLQQELNKKLIMRPVPKIRFETNEVEAEAARVEKLLAKIKKEET